MALTPHLIRFCAAMLSGAIFLIGGCVSAPTPSHTQVNGVACMLPLDLPDTAMSARIVMLGETHGTLESPQFAGRLTCLFARRDKTILALEIATAEQPAIDRYLQSSGDAASRRELLTGIHWQPRFMDGRSSIAMLELIERVRVLRADGLPTELLAFDGWEKGRSRDAVMAANIRAALAHDDASRMVILVGNAHADKARAPQAATEQWSLAQHLAGLNMVSLNLQSTHGSFWGCFGPKVEDCKVEDAGENPQPGSAIAPVTFLPGDARFDGVVQLGKITASLPANQ